MLSERSVALQEQNGPGRGLALSLATLGQILVHLGKLERAEKVLLRALEARGQTQFNEITGAVYDSLAQIAFMRGDHEETGDYLRQAGESYGSYGAQTGPWYEWSIRVLEAKLAARRGATEEALKLAGEIAAHAPPAETIQADLIATETLIAAGRTEEAESRLGTIAARIDARAMPGAWGQFLRLRGALHASAGRLSEAYHDIAQSASVFELIGEGYQSARSHLALGRLASRAGARAQGEHQFKLAASIFESLGAARDLIETRQAAADAPAGRAGRSCRARRSTPTMPSSGAWSTPPHSRNCSVMKPPPPCSTRSTATAPSCSSPRPKPTSASLPGPAATAIAPA